MDLWEFFRLMRLPSTKTLRAFQLAARSGSFKTAASQLFLTPSAVSHQIRALEEELGVPLFHRGARTLTLTDAGSTYLEEIEFLFERLDAATRELRARAGGAPCGCGWRRSLRTSFFCPGSPRFMRRSLKSTSRSIRTAPVPTFTRPMRMSRSCWARAHGTSSQAHRLFSQAYVPACSPALFARTADHVHRAAQWSDAAGFRGAQGWLGALGRGPAGLQMPRPRKRIAFNNMSALGAGYGAIRGHRARAGAAQRGAVSGEVTREVVRSRVGNRGQLLPRPSGRGGGPPGGDRVSEVASR